MTSISSFSTPLAALGGQLCQRTLTEGSVLVGLLRLPEGFVPQEGAAYLLIDRPDRIEVLPTALDQGVPELSDAHDVSSLLRQPIWNKTAAPEARVVRFLEAFPASNEWVVFGPSLHPVPSDTLTHRWRRADDAGRWHDIEAPVEACGMAVSQILTMHPIWPAADGTSYSLSALLSPWREHYHRYHCLLAQSARDPEMAERLKSVLREDPHLALLSYGSVDRDYCAFLAAQEDRGLLVPDAPRSEAEHLARDERLTAHFSQVVVDQRLDEMETLAQAVGLNRPRTRRSP